MNIQKQPKRESVLVVDAVVLKHGTEGTMTHANTGKKHSPETIKKIGWYWKGKHLSEEHRHKLSLSNKGKKRTQQTRDRISQAMTGRKLTHPGELAYLGSAPATTIKILEIIEERERRTSIEGKGRPLGNDRTLTGSL